MLSRRAFLAGAGACAVPVEAPAGPERRRLREYAYSQVTLTEGPLADMHRRMLAHFLKLDEDRLLKVYRQRVGMAAPGRDMGGWYDADGFVPGHLLGQFLSGLSRMYANTGHAEAAAKVRRLVAGYGATFERDGNPYASPKATATWACYVFDKYMIGLLDAATLAGLTEARTLLPRVAGGAARFLPDHTFDRIGVRQPPYDEPYVLPENLFHAYALTRDRKYLEMAKRYLLDRGFFNELANGENILPGKHGYSHMIALSSGAKAYDVLGDEKYLRAISQAWEMVEQSQQYASGAWAADEMFVKPRSGELAATLTSTRNHFETPCCYYAHSKLARYLTGFTGEARYGDGLERVLYNTILGCLDPDDDGGYFYYSDYQANAHKTYYRSKWPCCAGTLLQSVADFPLNFYFQDDRGIYVNLYGGSELRCRVKGVPVKLTQKTAYPEAEQVELRIDSERPVAFALRLRIPGWLEKRASVAVNDRTLELAAAPGSFAEVARRWRGGDRITLELPFATRAAAIEERASDTAAAMHGPVMLCAIDAPGELAISSRALAEMERIPGPPLEFDCAAASGKVRMRPFYRVQRERYSTYFRRS